MVKGIINAFDHMEFCLVIDLSMDGNQIVTQPQMFATRCVKFCYYLLYQVASTCYPPKKKLISSTAVEHMEPNLNHLDEVTEFTLTTNNIL